MLAQKKSIVLSELSLSELSRLDGLKFHLEGRPTRFGTDTVIIGSE